MGSDLVSVDVAGRALGVSRSTVWRMIQRGTLSSIRQGGRRLIRASALARSRIGGASRPIPAFTLDHPIFRLAGGGRGGGQKPGARDKHAILDR